MDYCIYILVHTEHQKTYCGITNNIKRRLRQHNKEIKGGAKYTTINKLNGEWQIYLTIPNLEKRQALSMEWKIHHTRACGKTPIERRLNVLKKLEITDFHLYDE